ncbi:hypothetical protein GFL18_19610 [Rhizobium leguminosarum bv. viciae]|nr:hypothetical protein [Rhizobium leguminosarum bv. viciae]
MPGNFDLKEEIRDCWSRRPETFDLAFGHRIARGHEAVSSCMPSCQTAWESRRSKRASSRGARRASKGEAGAPALGLAAQGAALQRVLRGFALRAARLRMRGVGGCRARAPGVLRVCSCCSSAAVPAVANTPKSKSLIP